MPTSAWVMGIAIAVILYGGLGLCIGIAVKRSREQKGE
jgi:hypothetical protein